MMDILEMVILVWIRLPQFLPLLFVVGMYLSNERKVFWGAVDADVEVLIGFGMDKACLESLMLIW